MLHRYIPLILSAIFLGTALPCFAVSSTNMDAPILHDNAPEAPTGQVIYKRKQDSNSYPLAASPYENNFLKSMMGVNMQASNTRNTEQ